jgi:hypothetical protein
MGLFDSIGSMFGGDSPSGYSSQYTPEYEGTLRTGIYNRLGAKPKLDANGKPTGQWDTSGVGESVTPKQAQEGYSMGAYNDAVDKAGKSDLSATYKSGYTPTNYNAFSFNYQTAPDKYFGQAYEQGAKGIRREQAGNLQQVQEQVGVRRPGLLLKASQDAQRGGSERMADLRNQLMLEKMRQGVTLSQQQQQDQAGENLKAATFGEQGKQFLAGEKGKEYASEFEKQKAQASQNNQFADIARMRIGTEQGLTESERNYRDRALEYLQQLFNTNVGSQNQAANIASQNRGQDLNFLGSMMKPSPTAYIPA